jgi:hypothetical protein
MSSTDVTNIINALTEQEKVLILCNYELYGGRWDLVTHDLVARLEGRPYIFKLGERIRDDIERVKRLRTIEEENGIRLGDYVEI